MQDISFKEEMLKETFNYKGSWFWENYILTNIVKNLPKEIRTYGNSSVLESYSMIYGEAGKELYEFLVNQDIDVLTEASKIDTSLLFESYGEKQIKTYLNEKFPFPDYKFSPISGALNLSPESPAMKAARGTIASQYAVGGLISKAWEKLKSVGRAIFAPIIPYLKQGFAWAKGLVQQGVAWFNKTPWAKMVLPLLLISGGVLAAKKLINKLRKRKMSPEEEVALKSYAMKNNTKINELRKKANLSPIKVNEETLSEDTKLTNDIKFKINSSKRSYFGNSKFRVMNNRLIIVHHGKPGSTEQEVKKNAKAFLGIDPWKSLKMANEQGSPDSFYTVQFVLE